MDSKKRLTLVTAVVTVATVLGLCSADPPPEFSPDPYGVAPVSS